LKLCVKSKTRDWDHNIKKFAEMDHKIPRKLMISYIKKGVLRVKILNLGYVQNARDEV
jgi:hypothetical protein